MVFRTARPRLPWLALPTAAALFLMAGPSAAVPPGGAAPGASSSAVTSSAHQGAMKAYAEARVLYQRGQYRDAVKRLEEARVLDPTAKELVYNLALVHEKLGELDEALRYTKMYAAIETDPAERERAEKTVERLEGARKDLAAKTAKKEPTDEPPPQAALVVPTAAPPPPSPPPRRGRLDAWTIGAAGVSVVGLGAGTFFGISALSQSPNDPTTSRGGNTMQSLRDDASSAHGKAIVADIGFGVAVVAGAAAVILYFTRTEPAAQTAFSSRGLEVSF